MSLVCQFQGNVAEIVFRNSSGIHVVSETFRSELAAAIDEIESRDSRIVVFRAEGKTFLAGADLKELSVLSADRAEELTRTAQRLMNRIASLPAVTVAAIHAPCLGGGLELALACDLRIASTSAKFGTPEVSLGLIPGWGGTIRLATLFGSAVAKRLVLTGDVFGAEDALRFGLVSDLVPDDALRPTVEQLVSKLLARGPAAQRRLKRLLTAFENERHEVWLNEEAKEFIESLRSEESAEGIRAFLEKRPPQWPRI